MLFYFFYYISFCESLFYGGVSFYLYFFYFISFCYSLFCGSVSFSLYFFSLFYSLSLLFLFYLGGSLVLVQVKQVRGVLQSFYYKNRGRGSLYTGHVITKK